MRVLASGRSVALDVRPASTLSGERLLLVGVAFAGAGVPGIAAPLRAPSPVAAPAALAGFALSPPLPVVGAVCAAAGVDGGAATAPPLEEVCAAPPFAVAAAALSAARLSLASSIVHAAASSASIAATMVRGFRAPRVISPSRGWWTASRARRVQPPRSAAARHLEGRGQRSDDRLERAGLEHELAVTPDEAELASGE